MWSGVAWYRCWLLSLLASSSALLQSRDLPPDADLPDAFLSQLAAVRSRARQYGHDPAQAPGETAHASGRLDGGFPMEGDSFEMAAEPVSGATAAARWSRSPRRCIRHQQSCLGLALPCCDACDTCYCRFFNAICYCRRVGHACPPART